MKKYNIIQITVDSWNRNFIGCYNKKAKEEKLTPFLDKFSKESFVFTSAFSNSVKTSVSVLSILSGCYPSKYGDWFSSISDKRIIISQILKKNGYYTYGFSSNPCTSKLRRYDKGYDIFRDDNVIKHIDGRKLDMILGLKVFFKNPYSSSDSINKQVLKYIDQRKSPYYVNIHYMDMHGPYISKNGWKYWNRISAGKLWKKAISTPKNITVKEKENLKSVYKEQMVFLDDNIKKLLSKLDDKKTIILITGDHGDVFGSHGYFGHPEIFYNEMINVPLFIKLPPELKLKNRVCEEQVSLTDLIPTIVDILKLDVEEKFDGESFYPIMKGANDKKKDDKYIISEISRISACIINGTWKLIANFETSSFELYNWMNDYEEKRNLIKEQPDTAKQLKKTLMDHINGMKANSR